MSPQSVPATLRRSELGKLVDLFVSELPLRLSVIEQLVSANDRESLCRAAHQLKSSAGSYGFGDLCLYAGRVEALCRSSQTSQELLLEAVDELLDQAHRVAA
ncbi:Hpt domain-containing protein [Aeoliella mucimassa]|uniref:Hpt domain protein n=1 Tax=Aeoliella mucimassa TaxID=2527972 RepID=A0A518ATQ6_9BACT|nr:Hpt domain-containing protein [Aeoliella mucimassa]QDU58111.1 Hpt domain protein [Aeoliella mucimassa]